MDGIMKRDGRKFDHQTLEEIIRLMAIERVRDGEPPSEVISAYGFNRTTIYKWIQAPRQEGQVFRWVNGRDPRQYGLDFGLWTRAAVVELVKQKFDVTLGLTAVGELLANHGLAPQEPLQRAYQRDPQAVEKWQRETWPAIAQQARGQGAEVFFSD